MGSAKVANTQPHLPMAEDKKSIKNILTKPLKALNAWRGATFQNKKKDKTKSEEPHNENVEIKTEVTPVDKLLENFHNLQIKKEEEDELNNFAFKEVEEDELDKFSYKAIEEEKRSERTDSHSSQDSGFSDKSEDVDDKVIQGLQELKLEDGKEKKKKFQTVAISRTPIKTKSDYAASAHPYSYGTSENSYRQINQINKQTFSGGHVIFNATRQPDNLTEVDLALKRAQLTIPQFPADSQQQDDYWDLVQELINEESYPDKLENPEDILEEFIRSSDLHTNYEALHNFVQNEIVEDTPTNPIDEFHNYEQFDTLELSTIPVLDENCITNNDKVYNNIFPTPPRSENVPSPMSDSQASFYPSHSEYTLSPELSSPINSDYEKYQDISQFDELPSCVSDSFDKEEVTEKKTRERNASTSSMTMKQFKDLQKELSMEFSKKECCQTNRKPCKEIFQEHIHKLKMEERKSLCLKVASMDMKTAYGVLHHILLSLSRSAEQEDLQLALFCLICERVLSQKPELYLDDFGLSLLKASSLRCGWRPLLTRYLVQCARAALRLQPSKPADCVYREIDAQGDNLLIACARAGDAHADALAELVGGEPPLFGLHHANAEGYSALHVACRQHSAASPCMHVLHVLLEHAGADLWRGDVKGEDTALHLAVNSPTCDLRLVMVMFRTVDRKLWKKLAHVPNRSSVTPLEYARCATKSTSRQNYPQEVLEFLKKCR